MEASARKWLQVQGGAVKCLHELTVVEDAEHHEPGLDLAGQLSTLLASLPALTSIDELVLQPLACCAPGRPGCRSPDV